MKNTFEQALQQVLKWEGFISGAPEDESQTLPGTIVVKNADPGGLTIWGISERSHKKAVYKMYRLIQTGKKDEAFEIAEDIYYKVYWIKTGCQNLDEEMSVVVFDTAVNMGRSRAKKLLEESDDDWKDYMLRRLYTYSKFRQAKLYFRGWSNRCLDLWKFVDTKLAY